MESIEINLKNKDGHAWGHITHDKERTLLGMYEDGKVARELFYMDNDQLKQMAEVLTMLANKTDK